MRIISGEYKGRHFSPPKNLKARPTTDIAKEGLFDILSPKLLALSIKFSALQFKLG